MLPRLVQSFYVCVTKNAPKLTSERTNEYFESTLKIKKIKNLKARQKLIEHIMVKGRILWCTYF